jgi:hypothetical protein
MVGAPAAQDAIARARILPSLGVGLHLTLLESRPVLPPEQVPGLVGPDGRFPDNPVRFGLALFLSPELRRHAKAEIGAQFERFRETGLVMDQINGKRIHPRRQDRAEPVLSIQPLCDKIFGPLYRPSARHLRHVGLDCAQNPIDAAKDLRPGQSLMCAFGPMSHLIRRHHEQLGDADLLGFFARGLSAFSTISGTSTVRAQ